MIILLLGKTYKHRKQHTKTKWEILIQTREFYYSLLQFQNVIKKFGSSLKLKIKRLKTIKISFKRLKENLLVSTIAESYQYLCITLDKKSLLYRIHWSIQIQKSLENSTYWIYQKVNHLFVLLTT